jgi:hypothetical protein
MQLPGDPPSTAPDAKAQKSFTDPESRIMKSKERLRTGPRARDAIADTG